MQVYLHTGGGQFILLLLPPSQFLLPHPPRYIFSELHSGEKIRPTQGPLYRWTNLLRLRTGVATACLHILTLILMSIWFEKSFICRSERIPRMGDQGACCPVKQVRVFPSSLFSIFFKKCVKCRFPLSRLCTLIKYIGVENPLFKFQGYSC